MMYEGLDPEAGAILLVDKPLTWTSFNVVGKVRSALQKLCGHRVKVGHAGTLDPLATGLLIIGTGRMTKQLPGLTAEDKEYITTIRLGQTTASYDTETELVEHGPWEHLSAGDVETVLRTFVGPIEQRPPNFSAKRFQGERAYKLQRWGEPVDFPPVSITINALELQGIDGRDITFRVSCSKGTYIRSLGHDIGQALGCGAHITSLRRTRSGAYGIEDALTPVQWSNWLDSWAAGRQQPGLQET
jgi:tRNA pseudouridine55 synthase